MDHIILLHNLFHITKNKRFLLYTNDINVKDQTCANVWITVDRPYCTGAWTTPIRYADIASVNWNNVRSIIGEITNVDDGSKDKHWLWSSTSKQTFSNREIRNDNEFDSKIEQNWFCFLFEHLDRLDI